MSAAALRLLAWLAILSDRREPGSPRAGLRTSALAGAYRAAREVKGQGGA